MSMQCFAFTMGPVVAIPTATSSVLAVKKWSLGPTAVGVNANAPWMLGALIGQ